MTLAKWQIEDMESLEGRDLMYFLLDCYDKNVIEGDNITQFLTENISDYYTKERRSAATMAAEDAKKDATAIKGILEEDPRYK